MNIVRTKEYLKERYGEDYFIEDDRLESIGVYLLPHYGHLVCLVFNLKNYKHPLHNDTNNIGAILHHFSLILDIREDGDFLHEISQSYKSVKSVWVNGPAGKECVGFGHSWKDQFILFGEFHLAEV